MKISNERREVLKKQWLDGQITHTTRGSTLNLDKVADYFLDILDQELYELRKEFYKTDDVHTAARVYEDRYILDLPILQTNPPKDNEEEA